MVKFVKLGFRKIEVWYMFLCPVGLETTIRDPPPNKKSEWGDYIIFWGIMCNFNPVIPYKTAFKT